MEDPFSTIALEVVLVQEKAMEPPPSLALAGVKSWLMLPKTWASDLAVFFTEEVMSTSPPATIWVEPLTKVWAVPVPRPKAIATCESGLALLMVVMALTEASTMALVERVTAPLALRLESCTVTPALEPRHCTEAGIIRLLMRYDGTWKSGSKKILFAQDGKLSCGFLSSAAASRSTEAPLGAAF